MTAAKTTAAGTPPAEGYWAVEIRLADRKAASPRYLCHAADAAAARIIAGDLMGPSVTVHGFDYYRLTLPLPDRAVADLPALGGWEPVRAGAWAGLMLARA
jgi:hypothetical protein